MGQMVFSSWRFRDLIPSLAKTGRTMADLQALKNVGKVDDTTVSAVAPANESPCHTSKRIKS